MKRKLLALTLLGAGFMFGQVSLGIRIGQPPPPRVVRVTPRSPGTDYTFINGYWYAQGSRWRWHDGYWTRPPYEGARWVAPRHDGERFYEGRWEGGRSPIDHDHRWDRDRRYRDYRDHDHH